MTTNLDLSDDEIYLLLSALRLYEEHHDNLLPRDETGLVTIADDDDFDARFLDGRYNDDEEEVLGEAWYLIRDVRALGDRLFKAGGLAGS